MRRMSERYEVVVTCFLGDDTPAHVLETLRGHLGDAAGGSGPAAHEADPWPLLEPDPGSDLPGGETAVLRPADRHAWGLFSRTHWHEDDLGHLDALLGLLAPHVAEPGYGGHVRATTAGPGEPAALPAPITFAGGGYSVSWPADGSAAGPNRVT